MQIQSIVDSVLHTQLDIKTEGELEAGLCKQPNSSDAPKWESGRFL